jgi:hypothetical protein
MRIIISLILILLFAFLSAYYAKQRGRDPLAWFTIGILLGIFAPLLLFLLKPLKIQDQKEKKPEIENEVKEVSQVQEFSPNPYGDKVWYYLDDNNQQKGPLYFSTLKSLFINEKIKSTTYVWSEGMSNWKRISELPGFIETL